MDNQFPKFIFGSTIVTDEMLRDDAMRGRLCQWIASDYTGEDAEKFDDDLMESIEDFIYAGSTTKSDNQPTLKQLAAEYKDLDND